MNANAELITWSEKLACGIKQIDEQHKGLVEMVNEMFNHCNGDRAQERDYFDRVINEAVNYVKTHFALEEKVMAATEYPGYAKHKNEHDNFIITVAGKIKDYKDGNRLVLSTFTMFLKNWVLSHIAMSDKQCFNYVRKIATRKSDGKLSITLNDIRMFRANS